MSGEDSFDRLPVFDSHSRFGRRAFLPPRLPSGEEGRGDGGSRGSADFAPFIDTPSP